VAEKDPFVIGSDSLVIAVEDVATQLRVGVSPKERESPQAVAISIALHVTPGPSFEGRDHLAETIDYDGLIAFLKHGLAEAPPAALIETVAERAAAFAFNLDQAVTAVDVRVAKPSVLGAEGLVSVRLCRRRL